MSIPVENRWSERQHVRLHITLFDDGREILRTSSRDLSIGGIFIDTGARSLDIDKKLEIAFSLRGSAGTQTHCLSARVVRNHHDGAALAFSDYDAQGLTALRVLLYDGISSK